MDNQDVGWRGDDRVWRQDLAGVERQIFIEHGIDDDHSRCGPEQSVLVACRPHGALRGHIAPCARGVLDDDRLTQGLRKLVTDYPSREIGGTSPCEAYDDANWLAGIGWLGGYCICWDQHRKGEGCDHEEAGSLQNEVAIETHGVLHWALRSRTFVPDREAIGYHDASFRALRPS